MSEPQKFGIGDNVIEALRKNAALLAKGAMDAAAAIAVLEEARDAALAANEDQHRQLREARESTARSVAASQHYYVLSSGFLDMAIGAVKKDSEAAAEFRKIRSRAGRSPNPAGPAETPSPVEPGVP